MIIVLRVLLVVWLLYPAPVYAHEPLRPQLNEWYDGLRAGSGPCCSGSDGLVVANADWESIDGHYRVRLENQWIRVPDSAVIDQPNLDGRTLVWPIKGPTGTSVRCFMPGPMI